MIRIRNVGINHGDCFFIEIVNGINKCIIMVDGRKGDGESFNEICKVIIEYRSIDYLVLTHIDNDHIRGVLKVFSLPETNAVRQAFYNTIILYNYVTKPIISYSQACEFEKLIQDNRVISTINESYKNYFSPCLKILSNAKRKVLDPRKQEGYGNYAVLTILFPHKEGIEKVYRDYIVHPKRSTSELINRNSIAFLLEYGEYTALFTGDCYMKDIVDEIDQLKNMKSDRGYHKINLIKIPHHGAERNNEGLAGFAKSHCTREFIVTGSKEWDEKHPSKKILQELNAIAADMGRMMIHTHVDLPMLNELKFITIDKNDFIEWGR